MKMKENIVIINGEKYYALPEHSYYYPGYTSIDYRGVAFNHSYIRLPVEGSTTVYADSPVTHVWLRDDDVRISLYPDGSVQVSWDSDLPDPFVNMG